MVMKYYDRPTVMASIELPLQRYDSPLKLRLIV
jgi:hypothetical protein